MLEKHWGVERRAGGAARRVRHPAHGGADARLADEMAEFVRGLLDSTLKANDSLGGALVTGITRVAREPVLSDLNNLAVAVTATRKYETSFGFTEQQVAATLAEYGMEDGHDGPGAVWPLLLAAGYLRVVRRIPVDHSTLPRLARARAAHFKRLELALTNLEVEALFQDLVSSWFGTEGDGLVPLARVLLAGDQARVQAELGAVVSRRVSSFDAGTRPSPTSQPERLHHGLSLVMPVSLIDMGCGRGRTLRAGWVGSTWPPYPTTRRRRRA